MKECRVILTWDCNLKCEYCCNDYPGMRDTFKPLEEPSVLENYDIIKISGGEPTLIPTKIQEVLAWARWDTKVYLYSNGADVQAWLDFYEHGGWGVNYSPHVDIDFDVIQLIRSHGFPLRIRLQDTIANEPIVRWMTELGCIVHIWKLGECETVEEDRWDASKTIF